MEGNELEFCTEKYKKWKTIALTSEDLEEAKKAAQKAFFWLELYSAYLAVLTMEKFGKKDLKSRNKIFLARIKICKKLNEYSRQMLNDLKL
ncbi:MAG: hypothetical protein ACP5O8_03545 [Candidatus Aenigmatarchaeota archaeon]